MVKPGGQHLIADLYGIDQTKLIVCSEIDHIFIKSAVKAGATVLGSKFHHFGEGCGVTGVVILSESHISVHTWPEENYCSLDIYMCGGCNPLVALENMKSYFNWQEADIQLIMRGRQ